MTDIKKKQKPKAPATRVVSTMSLLQEMYEHCAYCGWGDAWERSVVTEPVGLRDRVEAHLKGGGRSW